MTDQIISEIKGRIGHIILNRPKALNALTLEMCVEMTRLIVEWEKDDNIVAVVVSGSGDRAFCAGGDVILLHDSGKAGDDRAEQFWRTEYALNELIHRYSKPYISMIDGIVMGGGVGLSVHGKYRIAGDNTLFAMPETGIGYFPDVGGTYFLPRLGRAAGQWLGLTGARLGAADCLALGIANGYIASDRHEDFIEALSVAKLENEDDILEVMSRFHEPGPDAAPLPSALSAFEEDSVAYILDVLDNSDGEWAAKQASIMRKKSPLALCATFEALNRGADMDFRAAMTQELDISLNFLKTQDFYEGIRAQLIDKDRNPKWLHDSVKDVPMEQVEKLFKGVANPRQEFLS